MFRVNVLAFWLITNLAYIMGLDALADYNQATMTSQNDGMLHASDYVALFLTLMVGYRVFFAFLHQTKMHCKYREGNKKYYIDEIDLK